VDRIATLQELKDYLTAGLTLEEVIARMELKHGIAKIFDHSPPAMQGMKFRYFVVPLDKKGQPITKLAKGQNM